MSCYCGEDYHEHDHTYNDHNKKHKIFTKPQNLYDPAPVCIFHPNQLITNFCISPDCFMPLCPQCVEEHLDLHRLKASTTTDSFIKTFDHVRIHSIDSLRSFLNELNNEKRDMERIGFSPENMKMQLIKDLELSKSKVIAVVEAFFADMHRKIDSEVFQASGFFNLNENMMEINKRISELTKSMEHIQHGGQKSLKHMILLNNHKVFMDTANFLEAVRGSERKYLNSDLKLNENLEELNNIATSLQRFVAFSSKNTMKKENFGPNFNGMMRPPIQEEFFGSPPPMSMSGIDPRNNRRSFQPILRYSSPPGFRVVTSQPGPKPVRWAEA